MIKIYLVIFFFLSLNLTSFAQAGSPQLLKEPQSWAFERFSLPPVFAPDIMYKGAEELRFSPGMFNKDSADYFSYAFVAQLDSVTAVSQADISNYLLIYFKGLCSATARDRKLSIDTSKIDVWVEKKSNSGLEIYNALLDVFGVFTDGAPVKLDMEVRVVSSVTARRVYLVCITSPQQKTAEIWKALYKIQKGFTAP